MLKKMLTGREVTNVGKAEIKITVLFIYYTLLGVMGLVAYTYLITDTFGQDIAEFIVCESTGTLTNGQKDLGTFKTLLTLVTVNIVMVSFIPVLVVLIFSCEVQVFKRNCCRKDTVFYWW